MVLLRLILFSFFASFLISRGAASEPNWFVAVLGLALWINQIENRPTNYRVQFTFITWYLVGIFSLDWLRVLGWDAQLLLCLLVATSWALLLLVFDRMKLPKRRFWNYVAFASGVVALETVLSFVPFGGFNWLRIAYLLPDSPAVPLTYWFGISSLSFIGILFAQYLSHIKESKSSIVLFILGLFILISIIPEPNFEPNTSSLNVLVVQGSVPRVGLDFNAQRSAVFFNHLRTTERAIDEIGAADIDLILWPENSSDIDPYQNPLVRTAITEFQAKHSIPILFGAVLSSGEGLRNAAVLATGEGLETVYIKRKLVPFGEYLPFRNLLAPLVSRFDRLPNDFVPGDSNLPVIINGNSIGVLICYEVAFDNLWQSYAHKSDFVFVLTNNATYGGTKQPIQQLRITQLQAIANGRPVAIASTSGITSYISDTGKIEYLQESNVPYYYLQEIPGTKSRLLSKLTTDIFNVALGIGLASLAANTLRIRLFRKH